MLQVELEEDYTVAPRPHPVSHPPVDAPLCPTCRHLDLSFFDPSCPGCADILKSRETRWVTSKYILSHFFHFLLSQSEESNLFAKLIDSNSKDHFLCQF